MRPEMRLDPHDRDADHRAPRIDALIFLSPADVRLAIAWVVIALALAVAAIAVSAS